MVDHRKLAGVLADFAHNLVRSYGISDILYQLGDRALELLPVTGAGIMLRDDRGDLRFATATDERTAAVEQLQIEFAEGPCTLAATQGQQVLIADLQAGDRRFPRFARKAADQGMRAVFAFPMTVSADERIGAFNLYRDRAGPLAQSDIAAGQVLANVASAYIVNSRNLVHARALADQLQEALDARVVIEQAKGRLVAELGLAPDAAFELLRSYGRQNNRRVRDVSQGVIQGTIPAARLASRQSSNS